MPVRPTAPPTTRAGLLLAALLAACLLAAVVPGTAATAAVQAAYTWADEPPVDIPFPESTDFSDIAFTGRYANYAGADTWYPSWASDGNLYSPYADGCGPGGCTFFFTGNTGWAKIAGDDPLNLGLTGGAITQSAAPYGGRYPSASLVHNGVWYYGSYTLDGGTQPCNNWCQQGPFVGFDVSTDYGATWTKTTHTPSAPLFGESGKNGGTVRLGALHFVDFGQNNPSPDGYAYLVGHGTATPGNPNNWIQGDSAYLVRVQPSVATINDEAAYQYWTGSGWSNDLADLRPLLTWAPGKIGSVAITYDRPLGRYLLFMSRPHDGINGTGTYDTTIMESASLTGGWRVVQHLQEYGTQAYFVNAPSKFISADGRTMWLFYSANYSCSGARCKQLPAGSQYNLSVHEIQLRSGQPTKLEAEHAELAGGAAFNDGYAGYSGPGFVAGYLGQGASTTFRFKLPAAGSRAVTLRYAAAADAQNRTLSVYVNGTKVRQTSLLATGSWATWGTRTETLALQAGVNTITYRYDAGDNGWVNLDSVSY